MTSWNTSVIKGEWTYNIVTLSLCIGNSFGEISPLMKYWNCCDHFIRVFIKL